MLLSPQAKNDGEFRVPRQFLCGIDSLLEGHGVNCCLFPAWRGQNCFWCVTHFTLTHFFAPAEGRKSYTTFCPLDIDRCADKFFFSIRFLTEPFTKYKLWLKAFTWKNEGEPSEPFEMVTDVEGPSAPIITNLTCKDERSIYLEWDRPDVVYKDVDYYLVYFRGEDKWQFDEVVIARNISAEDLGDKVRVL